MSVNDRLYHRAQQLFAAGKTEDARIVLVNVLESDPNNVDAWFLYQETLSDPAKQTAILEKILRLEPNHQEAKVRLAQLSQEPTITIREQDIEKALYPSVSETEKTLKQKENYQLAIIGLVTALIVTFFSFTYIMFEDSQQLSTQNENLQTIVAEKSRLAEAHDALSANHSQLKEQYDSQTTQLNTLLTEHDSLAKVYAALQVDFENVQANLVQLTERYNNLVAQYNDLNGRYTALEQEHNTLVTSYNSLNQNYTTLQVDYNSLFAKYNNLKAIALEPPYIHVTGERTIDLVFYRSNGEIDGWTVPFETLEANVVRGNSSRNNILMNMFNRVKLEGLQAANTTSPDFRVFVDPEPFKQVVGDLYYQSSSEQAFIYELWFITTQLTSYNSEMEETPRYPLETFLAGGGDCEDTAILLASMLKAAPQNWEVSLVYMDSYNPYQVVRPNHVMVHVRTGSRDYLIETTNHTNMEPYGQQMVDGWYLLVEN
ncbi:MAG: hypothetical protein IAF02_18200 [Anaerolineae bacterium]|nr:hypothetical protein [Anaerolineae bacterium]